MKQIRLGFNIPDEIPVPFALTKEDILKRFPVLKCFWVEIGWGYQMFWASSKDGLEVLKEYRGVYAHDLPYLHS